MLAKVLADDHYRDLEALVMALADVLKGQVAGIDAQIIQVDEANVTGHPEDGPIAAAGINRVLEAVPQARQGRSPLLRQLRGPDHSERHLREARGVSERARRRTTWCWRWRVGRPRNWPCCAR